MTGESMTQARISILSGAIATFANKEDYSQFLYVMSKNQWFKVDLINPIIKYIYP